MRPTSLPSMLLVQFAATGIMTGVIWVVQLIVYPGFLSTDTQSFSAYHADYSNRITWIVFPAMAAELASAAILAWGSRGTKWTLFFSLNLASVLALWGLTAFLQVPQHSRLAAGYDETTIRELVSGNWFRTILWSMRMIALGILFPKLLEGIRSS